jgi:hypothetical protein
MTSDLDADERRIRHILRRRGVGPDALPPQPAPAAARDGGSWWDALYAEDTADTHPDTARTTQDKARIGGGRLPDWRKGETADLRGHHPDTADTAEDEDAPDTEGPDSEHNAAKEDKEDREAAVARPAPARQAARRAHAAYTQLAPRTRVLIYNGTAAGIGWGFGLIRLFEGWITDCQHDTGHISAALALGTGLVVAAGTLVDRHTRHWWGPLPWLCRTPLASAVLALALYAPASTL